MSDYLGNLAARSLDPAGAAVRPRLASRFEPAALWAAPLAAEPAGEEAFLETAGETAAAPARASRPPAAPTANQRGLELPEPLEQEPLPAPPRRRARRAPVGEEILPAPERMWPEPVSIAASAPAPIAVAPLQGPVTGRVSASEASPVAKKAEQGRQGQEKSGIGTLLPVPAVLAVPAVPAPVRLVPPSEIPEGEAPRANRPEDRQPSKREPVSTILQPRVTVIEREPFPARREAPAPTIHVSIGRIEVRATAVPKAPARERPSAPAAISLDDYLRRRAKGGEG